jgi:hypothetical protein
MVRPLINLKTIDRFRLASPEIIKRFGWAGDDTCGAFLVPLPPPATDKLTIIASSREGWDHVSVSLAGRCPTWEEMEFIKRLFFKPSETAMQLHVAADKHINCHPYCLHLWRPRHRRIPLPPEIFV